MESVDIVAATAVRPAHSRRVRRMLALTARWSSSHKADLTGKP
jgi:hypothetical protein